MRNFERKYRYQPPGSASRNNPLPDLIPPAMPPVKLIEAVHKRVHDLRRRRHLRKLLAYDDHILADIGCSRDGIRQALHPSRQAETDHTTDDIHRQQPIDSHIQCQGHEAEPARGPMVTPIFPRMPSIKLKRR